MLSITSIERWRDTRNILILRFLTSFTNQFLRLSGGLLRFFLLFSSTEEFRAALIPRDPPIFRVPRTSRVARNFAK